MIGGEGLLDSVRQLAAQEASITAMRISIFLLGLLATLAWARRRPYLALLAVSMGGFLGLGYWLVQIASPFGLSSDPALTRAWAQAGVNAMAEPKGYGFVWGTEPEISMIPELAALGLPFRIVVLAPQLSVAATLGLLVLLPFAFLTNRTTAAFTACLAAGGGLWPGLAPYGSILLHPAAAPSAGVVAGVLLVGTRSAILRRRFHGWRGRIFVGLIAAAALTRAVAGGAEPGVTASLLLPVAGFVAASSLRALVRATSPSPDRTRRLEALLLLWVFGGSGLLWWDPPKSVAGFNQARDGSLALQGSMEWIRRNVPNDQVVLASPQYSALIGAFAGRRVLFPPAVTEKEAWSFMSRQPRRERLLRSARLGRPLARVADAFSVTHLFLGPGEPDPPAPAAPSTPAEPTMRLLLVYQDKADFRLFRLVRE